MRIYSNAYELMSETGRNLWEMGQLVKPKTYQNKDISKNEDFQTKEICEQYCLTSLGTPEEANFLFVYSQAKDWCEKELEERLDLNHTFKNPGEAWKLRREMWEEFLNSDHQFDYTYSDRINRITNYKGAILRNLDSVIALLISDNDTRKAVLSIYDPSQDSNHYHGDARIPCSMYYDFLIRDDSKRGKQVNICYHQRSSDFCQHFGDDVYLAWRLMEYVAKQVGVKPGYLYHTIDSLHCYRKDWWMLKTSIDDIGVKQG